MRIDIITVLPDLLESPLNTSILKRAQDKGLVEINLHNLRDYSTNKQKCQHFQANKDERFKKEFGKRAREYEENAFEQFTFKRSKYF